jgi:hypothetical protein
MGNTAAGKKGDPVENGKTKNSYFISWDFRYIQTLGWSEIAFGVFFPRYLMRNVI